MDSAIGHKQVRSIPEQTGIVEKYNTLAFADCFNDPVPPVNPNVTKLKPGILPLQDRGQNTNTY
jgi:hypothetical protein